MAELALHGIHRPGVREPRRARTAAPSARDRVATLAYRVRFLVTLAMHCEPRLQHVTGRRHGGIQIPLSDDVLAAVDEAAKAHEMNRAAFLSRIIEVGIGLRPGHDQEKTHGHGCCKSKG
jgi:hypothetical protein